MGYQPFTISNFATGFDQERQPWLLPSDAFTSLLDGFIYKGVLNKREGYNGFANGLKSTYCESRMVVRITGEATLQNNNGTPLSNITLANNPIRRGTVTVTDGVESHTDNGAGSFLTAAAGSINYTTGVISGFQFNAASAAAVTVTYDYHQGLPVLGIMNFYKSDASSSTGYQRELIVADTTYVNRYNSSTDRLDDISVAPFSPVGSSESFWSWVNYSDPNDTNRLLFVNNKEQIQQYNDTFSPLIQDYPVYTTSTDVSGATFDTGDGGASYSYSPGVGALPGSITVSEAVTGQSLTDNGFGAFTGDGTGTVNYLTGEMNITFNAVIAIGDPILITYTSLSTPINTALQIFQFKDRLVVLRPTYSGGQVCPRRILISGTGRFSDTFVTEAPGAGFIDVPDNTWIQGATFNRDDLLIWTERSLWSLKYTGNDVVPFTLDKLDESRGSDAPFSMQTYLNRSMAASRRGMTISDGYRLDRLDDKIPDFVYNDVDNSNFNLCFSWLSDKDHKMYMLYPANGSSSNDRILVINFEEDTFAIYRIPFSVLGSYQNSFSIVWSELTDALGVSDWSAMGSKYATWNSFSWSDSIETPLSGGYQGQLWKALVAQSEDNVIKIRAVTVASGTVTVETDFNNYVVGDMVSFTGTSGLTNFNDTQHRITSISTANRVFVIANPTVNAISGTYTSGGLAMRVIPFEAQTKRFNPFIDKDKKLQLGYTYFYVDTDHTDLINPVSGEYVNTLIDVDVKVNDRTDLVYPRVYQVNCTNLPNKTEEKRWYKMWVNNTGKFVQLKMTNEQAGSIIRINAFVLGVKGTGRII